jgi:adenylylsulfate kinase
MSGKRGLAVKLWSIIKIIFNKMVNSNWVIWFTGLHGSGKSTIAEKLTSILKENMQVTLLDGDELRKTISSDLGYSTKERNEHMKRVADLCKTTADSNIVIASVASPTEQSREYARKVLDKILLVYVKCPLEICAERDVKGHYKKANENKQGFENFMKVSSNFEEPEHPDIILETYKESVEQSVDKLLNKLKEKGIIN